MCTRFNILICILLLQQWNNKITFSCFFIIKIVLSKSISIWSTSPLDVYPTSSLTSTCSSSTISLGTNGTTFSTFACYPITPTSKCLLFVTPPMPSITSTKTCWYALAFFAFFLVYIYQKHKQHNIILVPSSFSTISFVVIDKKRTTISYNKKKKNTTTSFAIGAK